MWKIIGRLDFLHQTRTSRSSRCPRRQSAALRNNEFLVSEIVQVCAAPVRFGVVFHGDGQEGCVLTSRDFTVGRLGFVPHTCLGSRNSIPKPSLKREHWNEKESDTMLKYKK